MRQEGGRRLLIWGVKKGWILGCLGYIGGLHEFGVPVSHFAACVPEGAVHAYEIAPFFVLEGLFEIFAS